MATASAIGLFCATEDRECILFAAQCSVGYSRAQQLFSRVCGSSSWPTGREQVTSVQLFGAASSVVHQAICRLLPGQRVVAVALCPQGASNPLVIEDDLEQLEIALQAVMKEITDSSIDDRSGECISILDAFVHGQGSAIMLNQVSSAARNSEQKNAVLCDAVASSHPATSAVSSKAWRGYSDKHKVWSRWFPAMGEEGSQDVSLSILSHDTDVPSSLQQDEGVATFWGKVKPQSSSSIQQATVQQNIMNSNLTSPSGLPDTSFNSAADVSADESPISMPQYRGSMRGRRESVDVGLASALVNSSGDIPAVVVRVSETIRAVFNSDGSNQWVIKGEIGLKFAEGEEHRDPKRVCLMLQGAEASQLQSLTCNPTTARKMPGKILFRINSQQAGEFISHAKYSLHPGKGLLPFMLSVQARRVPNTSGSTIEVSVKLAVSPHLDGESLKDMAVALQLPGGSSGVQSKPSGKFNAGKNILEWILGNAPSGGTRTLQARFSDASVPVESGTSQLKAMARFRGSFLPSGASWEADELPSSTPSAELSRVAAVGVRMASVDCHALTTIPSKE